MKLSPFQPHVWFGVSVVFATAQSGFMVLQGSKRSKGDNLKMILEAAFLNTSWHYKAESVTLS